MKFIPVALNTFRETIRDRILRVIVSISIFVIIISKIIGELSIDQDLKILVDFSLASIDMFGVVLCIFLGASLIHREIEKKTLYTVLSCPVHRWEFILGKFLGISATLFVTTGIMGLFFCTYYVFMGGELTVHIVGAIFLIFLGLVVLNSIAIFFSILSSPSVSIIVTAIIFFVGRSSYHLKYISQFYRTALIEYIALGTYYILPNFNNFDIKKEATHAMMVSIDTYIYALVYGSLYSLLMIYLSSLVINKRNL